jgi:hypothetical protein
MQTDKLVKAYINLRDARHELKAKYDEQDADLEKKMEMIEQKLLEHAKENGIDSMKTQYGTATRVVRTRYWAPDWDSFVKFLKQHPEEALYMVEKRIHQGNFKQFLEEHPDLAPPVNSDSRYSITVRRRNKL